MFVGVVLILSGYIFFSHRTKLGTESTNRSQLLVIDSLKAENRFKSEQLAYLLKYFDSSKLKIPFPKGLGNVGDTISNK